MTAVIPFINLRFPRRPAFLARIRGEYIVAFEAAIFAIGATVYSFYQGTIIAYGDAESHINIAKRVIDGLTPGLAQIGGIWLPLPHLLMVPFVEFDWLWRTGLAGSIVSGTAFIISALYIYKLTKFITRNVFASVCAALFFILNPNILYLQSTPMTEPVLIVFFILSSYYFIRFLYEQRITDLIAAAFFGLCASLSRYDGWGLVLIETGVLVLLYAPYVFNVGRRYKHTLHERWQVLEGHVVLFGTLAFFGIALWLLWCGVILGDPLYFAHSQYSANSQQLSWLARGELPAYHNIGMAFAYYGATTAEVTGFVTTIAAVAGAVLFMLRPHVRRNTLTLLILLAPLIFNVATLFIGQSVIFLPGLTPSSFDWTLFNVRYGTLMLPALAFFGGYLVFRMQKARMFGAMLIALQALLFISAYEPVLAYNDGTYGLSSEIARMPDSQSWFAQHYDYGMVLADDYVRSISLVRTAVSMKNYIYVGNKPYWNESFVEPEKYARWIIMEKNDAVWTHLYDDPTMQGRLFKYFNKVYTSENILIFRRM